MVESNQKRRSTRLMTVYGIWVIDEYLRTKEEIAQPD